MSKCKEPNCLMCQMERGNLKKATITKMSGGGYKWQVGWVYGFASTRRGAIWCAKRQAKSDRAYYRHKANYEEVLV